MGNEQTKLRPSTPKKAVGTGWNRIFRFGSSHLRWRTCIPRMHRFSLCRNSGMGFAEKRLSPAHNFRFLAYIRRPDRTFSIAVAYSAHRVGRSPVIFDTNYSIVESSRSSDVQSSQGYWRLSQGGRIISQGHRGLVQGHLKTSQGHRIE